MNTIDAKGMTLKKTLTMPCVLVFNTRLMQTTQASYKMIITSKWIASRKEVKQHQINHKVQPNFAKNLVQPQSGTLVHTSNFGHPIAEIVKTYINKVFQKQPLLPFCTANLASNVLQYFGTFHTPNIICKKMEIFKKQLFKEQYFVKES